MNPEQFDTKPLLKAIREIEKSHADIAEAEAKAAALEIEIKEAMGWINPSDEMAMAALSSRSAQRQMYPIYLKRRRDAHPALVAALVPIIAKLDEEVSEGLRAEQAKYREEAEPILNAMFFPYEHEGKQIQPGLVHLWKTSFVPRLPFYVHGAVTGLGQIKFHTNGDNIPVESWEADLVSIAKDVLSMAAAFRPYQAGSLRQAVRKATEA